MAKPQFTGKRGILNHGQVKFFLSPNSKNPFTSEDLYLKRKLHMKNEEYCNLTDLDSYGYFNSPASIRKWLAGCILRLPYSIFAGAVQIQIQHYYMVYSDNTICNE